MWLLWRIGWASVQDFKEDTWWTMRQFGMKMNPFLDSKASWWYSFPPADSFSFGTFPTAHQDITAIYSCWLLHRFLLPTAIPTTRKPFPFFGYQQICRSHSCWGSTCSSKPTNNIPCSKQCTGNSTIHSPLCPPEPPLPFTVDLPRCISSSVSFQGWEKKNNHIFFSYSSSKYHCTSLPLFSKGSPHYFSGHFW